MPNPSFGDLLKIRLLSSRHDLYVRVFVAQVYGDHPYLRWHYLVRPSDHAGRMLKKLSDELPEIYGFGIFNISSGIADRLLEFYQTVPKAMQGGFPLFCRSVNFGERMLIGEGQHGKIYLFVNIF